jgi:hypothetical protein
MALESYYLKVVQQTCPSTGRCASLDHVQMGGPSRFFPVGTPARRVRNLLLI